MILKTFSCCFRWKYSSFCVIKVPGVLMIHCVTMTRQSTLPRGERLSVGSANAFSVMFQSTLPRGERLLLFKLLNLIKNSHIFRALFIFLIQLLFSFQRASRKVNIIDMLHDPRNHRENHVRIRFAVRLFRQSKAPPDQLFFLLLHVPPVVST